MPLVVLNAFAVKGVACYNPWIPHPSRKICAESLLWLLLRPPELDNRLDILNMWRKSSLKRSTCRELSTQYLQFSLTNPPPLMLVKHLNTCQIEVRWALQWDRSVP